jgi:hypothetical protein
MKLLQLRKQQGDFQPYYAVGDINGDEQEDFAVAVLDESKTNADKQIAVVIFHGPFLPDKPNSAFVAVKNYKVARPAEVLSVFKARIEHGHTIPARLDLGPGIFGSDDVQMIFYDRKIKRYRITYFYDE